MRPFRFAVILIGATMLISLGAIANRAKPAALPAKILNAKTVFVENHSALDEDRARSEFFDEVNKWNRWEIVSNRTDADLIVVLTPHQKHPINPSNPHIGFTEITIADGATGRRMWRNSMPWSDRGAVRDLVADLKQRIKRQQKKNQN